MKAQVGDRIILAGTRVDDPVRDGEVLEVKGSDGGAPYTVRWSDGHTGLVYPGPGSVMRVESGAGEAGHSEGKTGGAHSVKTWRVQVSLVETGDNTRATAMLISDQPGELRGQGDSHRSPRDEPQNVIGDEVAVARALRHLADSLLARAESDIEAKTGTDAYVRPL
ncbi:MAG TPA: dsRBD fold-containing protein [Dermatophilaceae bacterium]